MKKKVLILLSILILIVSISLISQHKENKALKETIMTESLIVNAPAKGGGSGGVEQCEEFIIKNVRGGGGYWYPGIASELVYSSGGSPSYAGFTVYHAECKTDPTDKYTAYCFDAGISGPSTGGTAYVRAASGQGILDGGNLNVNSSSSDWAEFSKALMKLYELDIHSSNPSLDAGLVNNPDYIATNMAVRALGVVNNMSNSRARWYNSYVATQVALSKKLYASGGAAYANDYKTEFHPGAFYNYGGASNGTTSIIKETFSLMQSKYDAADAASKAAATTTSGVITANFGNATVNSMLVDASTGNIDAEVTIPITGLKSFTKDPSTKLENLKVSSCPTGLTCQVVDETTVISDLMAIVGQDPSARNDSYDIKIKINGNLSNLTSKDINVSLSIDYYDIADQKNAFIVQAKSKPQEMQRFVLFGESGGVKTLSKSDIPIEVKCDLLKKAIDDATAAGTTPSTQLINFYSKYCDSTDYCFASDSLNPAKVGYGFDEDAFKAKCCTHPSITSDVYDLYCRPDKKDEDCVTMDVPETCDLTQGTPYGVKGYTMTTMKEGFDDTTKALDYELCLLGETKPTGDEDAPDIAGNAHELFENDYCEVACMEDWEFHLPNNVYTKANHTAAKAGTYITLSAKMKGSRTCVTSFEIDYEQFEQDVDDANEKAVSHYNDYLNNYAAANDSTTITKDYTVSTEQVRCDKNMKLEAYDSDGDGVDDSTRSVHDGTYDCYSVSGPSYTCTYLVAQWKYDHNNYKKDNYDSSYDYDTSDVDGTSVKNLEEEVPGTKSNHKTTSKNTSLLGSSMPTDTSGTSLTTVVCEPSGETDTKYYNEFKDKKEEEANAAFDSYEDVIDNDIKNLIKNINACTDWTKYVKSEYYKPLLEFEYDESYYFDKIKSEGLNKFTTTGLTEKIDTEFCDISPDKKTYECSGGSVVDSCNPGTATTAIDENGMIEDGQSQCQSYDPATSIKRNDFEVVYCDGEGGKVCGKIVYSDSSLNRIPDSAAAVSVKQKMEILGMYKPAPIFYSLSQGEAVLNTEIGATDEMITTDGNRKISVKDKSGKEYSHGHVLPIYTETKEGSYEYRLMIKNIGALYPTTAYSNVLDTKNVAGYGRLIGPTVDTSGNALGKESIYSKVKPGEEFYNFACVYDVKEDPCYCCGDSAATDEHRVVIDSATGTWDDWADTPYGSVAIDPSKQTGTITFNYKPISLNEIWKDRDWVDGTNWDDDKGKATLDEIAYHKENIYQTAEYSYVITPEGVATLKGIGEIEAGPQTCSSEVCYWNGKECETNSSGLLTSEVSICSSNFLNDIGSGSVNGVTELARKDGFTFYEDTIVVINDVINSVDDDATTTVVYASAWK